MAKIDIRENRAEMPERRNVLRKVISPAVAEGAVDQDGDTRGTLPKGARFA